MSTPASFTKDASIRRRSVLKGVGATAGAFAMGGSVFAGSAAADHGGFLLFTITPSTDVFEGQAEAEYSSDSDWEDDFYDWGIRNQDLVVLQDNGTIAHQGALEPTNVAGAQGSAGSPPPVGADDNTVVQVATLAFNPADNMLYGIANQFGAGADDLTREDTGQTGRFVFTVDPDPDSSTFGELTLVGGPNGQFKNMFGSTFNTDGSVYYGQTGGIGSNQNNVFTITVNESTHSTSVTSIGDLADDPDITASGITHTGQSWNKLAPSHNIVSIMGNFSAGDKDDLVEINPDLFDARVAADDVFLTGELISTAFNPCEDGDVNQQRVYTIRNGNNFLTADVDAGITGSTTSLGTITLSDNVFVVDNLAEIPQPCATACTRTIGYWKNHPGCGGGPGHGKGKSNKDTIESVLEECGGFVVGTTDHIYDGSAGDGSPAGEYDFRESRGGAGWPCDTDVSLIVDAIDGATAEDMDDQLLAQLLAAKLNVCNGATTSTGVGDITTTIDDVDAYFACVVNPDCDLNVDREQKEIWKDELDGYNNQNLVLTCE